LLERLGDDPEIIHVYELAMVREGFFSPGARNNVDRLTEARPAFVDRHPQPIEFLTLIATAHPKVQAPTAQDIEHRSLFCHHDGVMKGQNAHRSANTHALAPGCGFRAIGRCRKCRISSRVSFHQPSVRAMWLRYAPCRALSSRKPYVMRR